MILINIYEEKMSFMAQIYVKFDDDLIVYSIDSNKWRLLTLAAFHSIVSSKACSTANGLY